MLHQSALNNYAGFLESCVSLVLESRKAFSFQHHRMSHNNDDDDNNNNNNNNNKAVVAYVFWHLLGRIERKNRNPLRTVGLPGNFRTGYLL
jgi:hypothetical protein